MLCKYSLLSKECKVIGEIPVKNRMQEVLFIKMLKKDNHIFMIPSWADNIIIYDIKKDEFQILPLKKENKIKFCEAFMINDRLVCVPCTSNEIIIINTKDISIENKCDLSKLMISEKIEYFNDASLIDDNLIIMVSPQSAYIYEYNVKENSIKTCDIGSDAIGYSFIAKLKDRVALCDDKRKKILLYNINIGKIEGEYWPSNKKMLALHEMFGDRFMIDDYDSSWIGVVDENFIIRMEDKSALIQNRSNYYSYLNGINEKCGETNIYFDNCDASFNWISNDKIEKKIRIYIDEASRIRISKSILKEKIINESLICSLGDYLEQI